MASGGGQTKKIKPAEGDSPDKYEQLLSKSTEVCGHCNKKCTAKGEAVQCDLCYGWVHASCEGIKKITIDCFHKLQTTLRVLCIIASFTSVLFILNSFKVNGSTRLHTLSESL